MSDLLREMCVEYESGAHRSNEDAMRAALLWLADNVSDEMVSAFWDQFYSVKVDSPTNKAIAAALRAAAGGRE